MHSQCKLLPLMSIHTSCNKHLYSCKLLCVWMSQTQNWILQSLPRSLSWSSKSQSEKSGRQSWKDKITGFPWQGFFGFVCGAKCLEMSFPVILAPWQRHMDIFVLTPVETTVKKCYNSAPETRNKPLSENPSQSTDTLLKEKQKQSLLKWARRDSVSYSAFR